MENIQNKKNDKKKETKQTTHNGKQLVISPIKRKSQQKNIHSEKSTRTKTSSQQHHTEMNAPMTRTHLIKPKTRANLRLKRFST